MKWIKYIFMAISLAVVVSCGVTVRSSYTPTFTQLNIGMEDLEYLGETEISVTYDTYLLVFSKMRTVNGEDYDPAVIQYATLSASGMDRTFSKLGRRLSRASYKAYEAFPEADYFIVTRQESRKTVLILGKEVESKATVKAYRIKK